MSKPRVVLYTTSYVQKCYRYTDLALRHAQIVLAGPLALFTRANSGIIWHISIFTCLNVERFKDRQALANTENMESNVSIFSNNQPTLYRQISSQMS